MKRKFNEHTKTDDLNNEEFKGELQRLINIYCYDTYTATPDYILADYLMDTIISYRKVAKTTEEWYH